MRSVIWVGSRKGLFAVRRAVRGSGFEVRAPHFLGHVIHHVMQDPREPNRIVIGAKTGHLGPTVYRSADRGRTWVESRQPPAFRRARDGETPRAVDRVFWLAPGHSSERGTWYAGTAPAGLFRSEDHGNSWEPVAGFNDHPMRTKWAPGSGTPDGEFLHSVIVDPRDARHLYVGISIGGVFESSDGGGDWEPLNEGIEANFLPEPGALYGHDPHCVVQHPARPDRLYQQNHCGIYRLDRPARRWQRIGRAMPKRVGDVGFPIVLDRQDPDSAWVIPMDGTTVWPRTSVDGRPAVYRTSNGGKSWKRLDRGLPANRAWMTVLRQAFCADAGSPPDLYFGTTGGELWRGLGGGRSWQKIALHLPEIYSVTLAH